MHCNQETVSINHCLPYAWFALTIGIIFFLLCKTGNAIIALPPTGNTINSIARQLTLFRGYIDSKICSNHSLEANCMQIKMRKLWEQKYATLLTLTIWELLQETSILYFLFFSFFFFFFFFFAFLGLSIQIFPKLFKINSNLHLPIQSFMWIQLQWIIRKSLLKHN